jgi:tetraacyldisaccharide-1-P 4'-kinase
MLAGAPCAVRTYADHHPYTPADAQALADAANTAGAGTVVTTRKDWVKLAPVWPEDGPALERLEVRMVLRNPTDAFDVRLRAALESRP